MDFLIELLGEFFSKKVLWIIAAIAVLVAAFLLLRH
jgi:hypothetical protein